MQIRKNGAGYKNLSMWYLLGFLFLFSCLSRGFVIFFAGDDFDWIFDAIKMQYHPLSLIKLQGEFVRPTETLFFYVNLLLGNGNPMFHHAAAICIHLANVALVYALFKELCKSRPASIAGAMFWGMNYKHAEVIFLSYAISDALVLFCWLAAFLLFFRRKHLFALICFAISLISKENAIFFPCLLMLYIVFFRKQEWKQWIERSIPFWIITALFLGFRYYATAGNHSSYLAIDWNALSQFWENMFSLIGMDSFYIKQTWLNGQAYMFPIWVALLFFALTAVLAAMLPDIYRFGLLWTSLTMLPTMFIYSQTSRYRYIPLIGVAILIAGIVAHVQKTGVAHSVMMRCLGGVLAIAFLAYNAIGINLEASDYEFFGEMHRQAAESFQKEILPFLPENKETMFVFLKQDSMVWAKMLLNKFSKPWYVPGTYKVVYRRPYAILGLSNTYGFVSYCAYRAGMNAMFVNVPYQEYREKILKGDFAIIFHDYATNTFHFGAETLKADIIEQVADKNFYRYLQPGRFDSMAIGTLDSSGSEEN